MGLTFIRTAMVITVVYGPTIQQGLDYLSFVMHCLEEAGGELGYRVNMCLLKNKLV